MLLDKEIAKRKALDEHNHHVRVVAAVVAARRLMQRQAAAALETDGTAEWPRRAPFSQHDRKLAVRRMDKYSDKQFKARYRISRSTFDTILGRISPDLEPAERSKPGGCPNGHIPAKLKLGASLRFLAGSNHLDVADLHAMSTSSFYKHFYSVIDAITKHFDDQMHFPQTAEELFTAEEVMSGNWGKHFRGCIAALDGLVVHIRKPFLDDAPSSYYNRKGYYAIVVQAMCDGNRKFLMMSAEHQGACGDSLAWTTCDFYANEQHGLKLRGLPDPYFIVADAAYALMEWLLTPYDGKDLPPEKDAFNFWQSHYRINIECAFGLLQRRWGILRRDMEVDTHRVGHIVKVCMLLHNLCIDEKDMPVNPAFDASRNFEHGLHLQSDGFGDEDDEHVSASRRAGVDVARRIRMRNRLKRLYIVRPARGRLGSSNRRGAA